MFHVLVGFTFLDHLTGGLLSSFWWKVISKCNSLPDSQKYLKCVESVTLYKQKSLLSVHVTAYSCASV